MSAIFCGNPRPHLAHTIGMIGDYVENCEGVNREEVEEKVIIEKFEPNVPAIPAPTDLPKRSTEWMKGWGAAFYKEVIQPDVSIEFHAGFEAAILEQINLGVLNLNDARALLGATPYDPVKIPAHYNSGKIEVANFIADQELIYPRDNIVKYICRAGKKYPEKELEDIEKTAAYLQMAYNLAQGLPAVVRDPVTDEVVWSLFKN